MGSAGARRRALCNLLERGEAAEQAELARKLSAEGFAASQSTISRDLRFLGAVKDPRGGYRLGLRNGEPAPISDPEHRLGKAINAYAVSIEASANLVVLRTFPGAASVMAAAVDSASEAGEVGNILGTVAGDDTVLVVATGPSGGRRVKKQLESIGDRA